MRGIRPAVIDERVAREYIDMPCGCGSIADSESFRLDIDVGAYPALTGKSWSSSGSPNLEISVDSASC